MRNVRWSAYVSAPRYRRSPSGGRSTRWPAAQREGTRPRSPRVRSTATARHVQTTATNAHSGELPPSMPTTRSRAARPPLRHTPECQPLERRQPRGVPPRREARQQVVADGQRDGSAAADPTTPVAPRPRCRPAARRTRPVATADAPTSSGTLDRTPPHQSAPTRTIGTRSDPDPLRREAWSGRQQNRKAQRYHRAASAAWCINGRSGSSRPRGVPQVDAARAP